MAASGESERTQGRSAILSVAAAALLVAMKLGVGLATASLGLISAGIESSGDVVAAVVTFFAVRLGGKPADRDHPYGHRRAENLGALGEAAILLGGGLLVAAAALRHLATGARAPSVHDYQIAVIAAALAVDCARALASLRVARRSGSPALRANALHFGGDAAGSVIVLIGLVVVRAGFDQGDSIAALLVALIIAAIATRLLAENANVLMDRAPAEARRGALRAIASVGADVELSRLRLRESGGRYFADVVITVPPGRAVVEGHEAATLIESALHAALPGSDVVVHVEPRLRGLDLRERVLAIALAEPLVTEAHDIAIFEQGDTVSVSLHLKFPADLQLREAAEVAHRVEQEVRARTGVQFVQTHLEPLERTLAAESPAPDSDIDARREIERLVRTRIGSNPAELRLLSTEQGAIVFLTLGVDPQRSLSDAHLLAGELEEELRKRIPGIADVVIHTAA
jgi:cation diffusion facilitator family transporter